MKNSTRILSFTLLIACLAFGVTPYEAPKGIPTVQADAKDAGPFTQGTKTGTKPENLNASAEKLKIGETDVQVVIYKTSTSTPIYFRPHENESTSSDATKETLKKHGGTFVELKSKGERLISFSLKNVSYTFDPNRIFTAVGIQKTLKQYGRYTQEAEKEVSNFVTALFSRFLTDKSLIVAVHNNTDKGSLSVLSYKNSPEAASVNINPARDADDFFYVTNAEHFRLLKEKGFNVVLQNTARVADDGSLSVYCGRQGIAYINVESEHGHLQQQIEMMNALREILKR